MNVSREKSKSHTNSINNIGDVNSETSPRPNQALTNIEKRANQSAKVAMSNYNLKKPLNENEIEMSR